MSRKSFEEILEGKHSRRLASQDRYLARVERREARAQQMIGELASGKFYVYPVGGTYREGTQSELISFLVRNQYV